MSNATSIVAPEGMTGIAVKAWGEVYAVAANWSEASSPVVVWGDDGWTSESHGRQVADFRHSDRKALESVIREAIEMGGDEPDDAKVEKIVNRASEITSHEIGS